MKRTGERRDPTDGRPALRQPLLQADAAQAPLRGCLLSGGASRRMGTDKALLPHPEGGSWLERTLRLLLELDIPVTLLSRHPRHLQLAQAMASRHTLQPGLTPMVDADSAAAGFFPTAPRPEQAQAMPFPGSAPRLITVSEPPPWQGPLLALHRLMQGHPDERLLLCPVDMPWLAPETLHTLLRAAADQPQRIHLAHDGERLQPLLGVYPNQVAQRDALRTAIEAGERRLQGWLASQCCREVRLDRLALRNVNRPEQLGDDPGWGPAA